MMVVYLGTDAFKDSPNEFACDDYATHGDIQFLTFHYISLPIDMKTNVITFYEITDGGAKTMVSKQSNTHLAISFKNLKTGTYIKLAQPHWTVMHAIRDL